MFKGAMNNVCYKCEDRFVTETETCHNTCKKYLTERKNLDTINTERHRQDEFRYYAHESMS